MTDVLYGKGVTAGYRSFYRLINEQGLPGLRTDLAGIISCSRLTDLVGLIPAPGFGLLTDVEEFVQLEA